MNNLRKPKSYLRKIPATGNNRFVRNILDAEKINTICDNANCPNRAICFSNGSTSIMALGDICTRKCGFCAVKNGRPLPPDEKEPSRIANAVRKLNLKSIVITSPTRDDLSDGGANHLAQCVFAIKRESPGCNVELLIPDFMGRKKLLNIIMNSPVNCISHNIEMPKNLYKIIRDIADFDRSINVLQYLKDNSVVKIKTGFMLGLGEREDEILELIKTLSNIRIDILTLGQYFQPSKASEPVHKYYEEGDFRIFADFARSLGIKEVLAGVFMRSSYKN